MDRERADRFLYVVARDRIDIYHHLRASFREHAEVVVVLDRRRRERRQASAPRVPDRRRMQRRAPGDTEFPTRGWILVRVRPAAEP